MKKGIKRGAFISKICTIVLAWLVGLYVVALPIITDPANVQRLNGLLNVKEFEDVEVPNPNYKGPTSSNLGRSDIAPLAAQLGETFDPGEVTKSPTSYYYTGSQTIAKLKERSHQVSQDVTAEGSVLLFNKNNALPLSSNEKNVSFYDVTSVDPVWGGTGSGQATITGTAGGGSPGAPDGDYNSPSFPMATSKPTFKKSFEAEGFTVNAALWNYYDGLPTNSADGKRRKSSGWPGGYNTIDGVSWSAIPANANKDAPADAGIFVLGRIGGEDYDRKSLDFNEANNSSRSYLRLTDKEKTVLNELKALRANNTLKKLILIINSSNQPELDWLTGDDYGFDAALWVGGIGQDGLNAIAQIFSGKVNPSGRLPQMFWNRHNEYNPVYANFGRYAFGTGALGASASGNDSSYVVYQEGVYLGYRYAETRYEDTVLGTANVGDFNYNQVVAYPFGYGESYTNFEYSNFKVTKEDKAVKPYKTVNAINLNNFEYRGADKERTINKTIYTVTVDVKNNGSVKGKEVVQIYMQRPYGDYDKANKIEKPAVELAGFAKTQELNPGATETVTIDVDERYFAVMDAETAKTNVLTPGDYYLTVGKDAHNAVNNILAAKGKTTQPGGTAGLAEKVLTQQVVDAVKYKYSDVTGREVKNLFDFADINRYAGKESNSVTYISRNNWVGTVQLMSAPAGTLAQNSTKVVLTKTAQMTTDMNMNRALLPADQVAYPTMGASKGLMMNEMATRGKDGRLVYAYDDPKWQEFLDQLTWGEMASLLSNGLRRTKAIASVGKPETLDHNGPVGFIHKYGDRSQGDMPSSADKWSGYAGLSRKGVRDVGGVWVENDVGSYVLDPDRTAYPTAFASNPVLAATFNMELAMQAGKMIGEDGLWGGYNGIYGTGANILRAPHQGRCFEYFSEDGFLSGMMVAKWSRGVQSKGVLVYNKHFALNEQELNRYGIATFVNEQALREIYLRSFELPIILDDARAMMGALNRIGCEYAPASKALFTDWLRGEAGFQGFSVSDWWDNNNGTDDANATGSAGYYMQVARTLIAGLELPDGVLTEAKLNRYSPTNTTANAIKSGELAWAMREASHRICYAVADSWSVKGFYAGQVDGNASAPAYADRNSIGSTTPGGPPLRGGTGSPGGEVGAPSAPQNFTATPGNGQVKLSWSAPSSDGGLAIIRYEVSKDNGTTWDTASSDTGHTFTGLTNGTKYDFMVRAVNANGNGATAAKSATPTEGGGDCACGTMGIGDVLSGIFCGGLLILAMASLFPFISKKRAARKSNALA